MMAYQKSHQKLNSSDEEKAEIEYSSIKRNPYNGHQYIAISPDGTQIVSLNTETYQLKLCKFDNLTKLRTINYDDFRYIDSPTTKVNLSLAVSNEFTLADETVDVLIAVSCFDDNDMKYKNRSNEFPVEEVDIDVRDDMTKHIKESTWIISVAQQSRISSSINNMGGIVKFLDNKDDDSETSIILINTRGITKFFLKHENIRDIINSGDENYVNNNSWFNLFFSGKSIENFYFPTKFFIEIKRSVDETCSLFIQQSLIKDRLVVEEYKNKVQIVEMYNLKTNLLENTFQKSEESADLYMGKSSPCFAISNNESLFAYCRGGISITIYLMENGLEVTTKKFKESNVHKILFLDFVQDDSKLLIVIEEERYNNDTAESDVTPVIVVWDLFSSSDNCVRRINDTYSLFPAKDEYPQRLATSSGNLITITEDDTIISILNKPEIIKLLNSEHDNIRNIISLDKHVIVGSFSSATTSSSETDYHLIYNSSGECLDSKSEKFIVKNSEPWIYDKHYKRISAYLDDKSIQLIIGKSTVQLWRKRKGGSSSLSTRILEYIWTNNSTEKHGQMQIQSLEVGHKEFSLTLYIPPGISPSLQLGREIKLEWPEKVNIPVDACQALEFLDKKKNEPSGPKKQNQFEELVQQTECIIKKYLIKKCGLWRMLDIRFDIMANLIRGNCIFIIKNILFFESDNKKNKYLHIPRCYSWDRQVKETDLEIAIKCTIGGYRKDTIIVKYLLDYYSDNAVKSSNWMFTVTKAIPLLYKYQLKFHAKELFQKPCFGVNEVYLEKSSICNEDIIKSKHKDIHALNLNMGLIKRKEYYFLRKLIPQGKQSPSLTNQVYMAALPDFTVYPEGIDDEQEEYTKILFQLLKLLICPRDHLIKEEEKMSSFLRMIRDENSAEIFDNPTMAAVIDFKWNAARNFFIRHIFMYIIFVLIFVTTTDAVRGSADWLYGNDDFDYIVYSLFYWIGFYLLNIERVQLRYDGWKRYLSLYNFFDLFSVALPLTYFGVYDFLENIINDDQWNELKLPFTILKSFTVLILWMEFFLLLRYFEKAGAYIFVIINILQQIITFLIFIILVVFGFGHAMFVLLNNPPPDKHSGSSYNIVDSDEVELYMITQKFNASDSSDNYYTDFIKSVKAVFFWTAGRWDQLDQWNFWPVDVISIIGSILLVTILQNMLIAIMTGVYDNAKVISRYAALKYRAEMIADYETLYKPFGNKKGNPRYIYFIGKSEYVEEWLEKSKKAREIHKNFLAEIDKSNSWHYDNDDDDYEGEGRIYTHYSQEPSYAYSTTISSISNIDSDFIESSRDEQNISLSLYWFVDEDEYNKRKFDVQKDNAQNKVKMLQDKVQSMEGEIKNIISLIQNQ